MTQDSTNRPEKPTADFPLFPHRNGSWACKVRGRLRYFGGWRTDPTGEQALALYREQIDDLRAGREPRVDRDGLTVDDLVQEFLTSKNAAVQEGRLGKRTWSEYRATCARLLEHFGRSRLVDDLRPVDFRGLRVKIAKRYGAIRQTNEITRVKSVFKFAFENSMIDAPVRTGTEFKRPPARVLRKAKNESGPKMLTASQIRATIDAANVPMRAAILLGINCGMGAADVGELCKQHLDLNVGVVDYPRPKTQVQRRAVLWPETVTALREAISTRPKPQKSADGNRAILMDDGQPWVRPTSKGNAAIDGIGPRFKALLKLAGVEQKGVSFYTLRRVFQTVADGAGDAAAVSRIMGHSEQGMSATYRQWNRDAEEDRRLRAVADHVRRWLYPPKTTKRKPRRRGG